MRALFLALMLLMPGSAFAFDLDPLVHIPAEPRGVGAIPACEDPAVLSKIVKTQAWAEKNTWQDGVVISGISRIQQSYQKTKFVSDIEHRHCQARADLGSGRHDRLYYVISEHQGFASIGWQVEFCLPSHDPYHVYDADCRVLK